MVAFIQCLPEAVDRSFNVDMRWEKLFADLEAQEAAETQRMQEGNVFEVSRLLAAQTTLTEMLAGSIGQTLKLNFEGSAETVSLALENVGKDWFSGKAGSRTMFVQTSHVATIEPEGRPSAREIDQRALQIPFRLALRDLARRRTSVELEGGFPHVNLRGTLDQVGHDFCVIAVHDSDEYRRNRTVRSVKWVPMSRIVRVYTQW